MSSCGKDQARPGWTRLGQARQRHGRDGWKERGREGGREGKDKGRERERRRGEGREGSSSNVIDFLRAP